MRFVHHSTIALVPPSGPADVGIWDRLQQTRYNLRDKGYYRWPPHVNLVYPFIDPLYYDTVIPALTEAVSNIQPFRVSLSTFGTFGGRTRGVLWLDPHVTYLNAEGALPDESNNNPIYELQSCLMQALRCSAPTNIVFPPTHTRFRPHMTLCHYSNLVAADEKAIELSSEWVTHPVSFDVKEIYVMERNGGDGQFCIAHTLPLGRGGEQIRDTPLDQTVTSSDSAILHTGTTRFPFMPLVEDSWVRELRVGSRVGSSSGSGDSNRKPGSGPRRPQGQGDGRRPTTDTPEQIAEKRAQRAEKKRIMSADPTTNHNPDSHSNSDSNT